MKIFHEMYPNLNLNLRVFFGVSAFMVLLSTKVKPLALYTFYGKRLKSLNRKLNYKLYIPKSCFFNFYILGLILNSFLFYIEHREYLNPFRVMFMAHLVRRLFEQLFMFMKLPRPSIMHFFSYLFGLCFFVATSFSLDLPTFNFPFQVALVVNVLAQLTQFYCHLKLSKLRRKVDDDTGVYKVPKGGPFNYVLCPHYLAEIFIYASLCCNVNMLFCFLFVTVELALLAHSNRTWYRDTFKSALHTDKGLVPLLF